MRYVIAVLALLVGVAVAAPSLWYAHVLPMTPAVFSAVCIAFAFYLFDPTSFLAFWAEVRRNFVCWVKKEAQP